MPAKRNRFYLVLIFFLAYTHALITIPFASVTFDELAHLPAGVAHWRLGAPQFNPEHPPLAKLIGAIPAALTAPALEQIDPDWRDYSEWEFGERFLFGGENNTAETLLFARAVMSGIFLLLLAALFAWGQALFGFSGGIFSLLLGGFCPLLVAHGRLVTTDIPLAAFSLWAAYLWWSFARTPKLQWMFLAALASAAALLTKFSAVVLIAPLFLGALLCGPRGGEIRRIRLLCTAGLLILVLVGAVYGSPAGVIEYLRGMQQVGKNHPEHHSFLLLGRFSESGFPLYFTRALILKLSPAVLLAALLIVMLPFFARAKLATSPSWALSRRETLWFLALPALLYWILIELFAPQIGVRYLIPAVVFGFVGLGVLGPALAASRAGRILRAGIIGIHLVAAATALPDPLSYFNGLFGCVGSKAGECLDDSNYEWGQTVFRLASETRTLRGTAELRVFFDGPGRLEYYGDRFVKASADEFVQPLPRVYAISADKAYRYRIGFGVMSDSSPFVLEEPTARIGTYLLYDLRVGSRSR